MGLQRIRRFRLFTIITREKYTVKQVFEGVIPNIEKIQRDRIRSSKAKDGEIPLFEDMS